MDEWQSTGEIEAAFAEDGPILAARRWLVKALRARDLDLAWPDVDPAFRLVLAQRWVWGNRSAPALAGEELERVAEALAREAPDDERWPAFSEALLGDLAGAWPWADPDTIGAAAPPRLVAIDLELVVFAAAIEPGNVLRAGEADRLDPALHLLMRHAEGRWLVAGMAADDLPEPRWPPAEGPGNG
jgi:hypothetical protein